MEINAESGKLLLKKYLSDNKAKYDHCMDVGDLCFKVATKLKLNATFCAFWGYVHDIGCSIDRDNHEKNTIKILISEGIDPEKAKIAMHGHLAEEFGPQYLPVGIEGEILTYCDMCVDVGQPTTVQERANKIIEKLSALPLTIVPQAKKDHIIKYLNIALPRFKSYEKKFLALGQVQNVNEF